MSTEIAKYTEVNDGQVRWYAETHELVAALVKVGYTCEAYQGYSTLAEPKRDPEAYHEFDDNAEPYSDLCSRVLSIEADEIADGTEIETLAYNPSAVGNHRLQCSGGLYQAVWLQAP